MSKNCIVSVAFRQPYVSHSKRQEETIRGVDCIYYRDKLPMKDKTFEGEDIIPEFQKSLYGFKPHAIERARKLGYTKVVWFDPSVLPTCDVKILFKALDKHPVIVRTGDTPISRMCNQRAKTWFDVSEGDMVGVNHIGGTVYGFNFNDPKALQVFELWKQAEEEGIFGDQESFMKGHWADEACMVLALIVAGVPQYYPESFKYLNQKEL